MRLTINRPLLQIRFRDVTTRFEQELSLSFPFLPQRPRYSD